MIHARHNPADNFYCFLYSDKTHQSIEILRIESKRKIKGFIFRPLFNKKPHKISFVQDWLPMTFEFSKNTLTLKNGKGKTYFNFDARGEKPVMTLYHKNSNIFTVPDQKTARKAEIIYIDKAKGHSVRTVMRGLTAFSQLIFEGYGQLEEGIPASLVQQSSPRPTKVMVWGRKFRDIICDTLSLVEEGKPFNAYPNAKVTNRTRE